MNPNETAIIISEFIRIDVSIEKAEALHRYYELLVEWNRKLNLIRLKSWDEFLVMHILDSLSPLKWKLIKNDALLCDMGTGGGLPGIPVKIILSEVETVLVDSRRKKVKAVESILKELSLDGITAIWKRMEDFNNDLREEFDVILVRAVGNDEYIFKMALPLLKAGGICIIYGTAEKTNGDEREEGMYRYSFAGLKKDRVLKVLRNKGKFHVEQGVEKE